MRILVVEDDLTIQKQLKNLLPQAELHIIPGAGHEINKCKPEAVAAIIKSL